MGLILLKLWREFLIVILFVISVLSLYTLANIKDKHRSDLEKRDWAWEGKIEDILQEQEQNHIKQLKQIKEYEAREYKKTLASLEKAKEREITLFKHLSNSRDANDRLHNTIRELNNTVTKSTREAESRLRVAQEVSFRQCTDLLREVETDANRLANTVREFDERWPEQLNKGGEE